MVLCETFGGVLAVNVAATYTAMKVVCQHGRNIQSRAQKHNVLGNKLKRWTTKTLYSKKSDCLIHYRMIEWPTNLYKQKRGRTGCLRKICSRGVLEILVQVTDKSRRWMEESANK